MIKARTMIVVGKKTFQAGQTVTGLSKMDKKWMSDAGYIKETESRKEADGQPAQEETADGQLQGSLSG
nr:hypothetical protein [uncultured Acetatifactor sp.]